jgi:FkbM family methyltransferase
MNEWLKHAVIRTPFEGVAKLGRNLLDARILVRKPELYDLWIEEMRIGRLIARILKPTWNCLDVGAHLGINLSQIVRRAPRGSHIAFEPHPDQARWLKVKFPEVDVRQVAVSDNPGELDFFVNDDRSGFSGLRRIEDSGESVRSFRVPVVTLDSSIPPGHRVDFLKTVVEGAELSVLRGAEEILRRDRPTILFECVQEAQALYGVTPADAFEFLTVRHSYSIFLIKDYLNQKPALSLDRFESAQLYPFKGIKFVASPN